MIGSVTHGVTRHNFLTSPRRVFDVRDAADPRSRNNERLHGIGPVSVIEVVPSLLMRYGTNHPSRRRRRKTSQLPDFFSRRLLLMTSGKIDLNRPDFINSPLRTMPLWGLEQLTPRPPGREGEEEVLFSVFIVRTDACASVA